MTTARGRVNGTTSESRSDSEGSDSTVNSDQLFKNCQGDPGITP